MTVAAFSVGSTIASAEDQRDAPASSDAVRYTFGKDGRPWMRFQEFNLCVVPSMVVFGEFVSTEYIPPSPDGFPFPVTRGRFRLISTAVVRVRKDAQAPSTHEVVGLNFAGGDDPLTGSRGTVDGVPHPTVGSAYIFFLGFGDDEDSDPIVWGYVPVPEKYQELVPPDDRFLAVYRDACSLFPMGFYQGDFQGLIITDEMLREISTGSTQGRQILRDICTTPPCQ